VHNAGGIVTTGDWAAVIVAIAGILVAAIAVPANTPHRGLVFVVSSLLVLSAIAIGAATALSSRSDNPIPPEVTPSAKPTTSEAAADLERVAYVRRLTPICQAWKGEAEDALQGLNPTIDPTQGVSFYGGLSSILSRGSHQMQAVPLPEADTVVLSKLYNDFDLIVKYNDDMVAAARAGESSVALEISRKVEQQVQTYNHNAEEYGLNAACLMPSR
jgi:hypothetical protein